MALPGAIQDVAMRLPAAAARLAGVPGSGGPLEPAEAEQVVQMLATLEDSLREVHEANSTADALLSDDNLRIPMLHLVAFAVRISHSDPPAYIEVAHRALSTCEALLSVPAPSHRHAKALVAFARKLLRMDTLKCCSRNYVSAAARLAELAGPGEAGAAAGDAGAADPLLAAYTGLTCCLLQLATRTDVAVRLARSERQLEEWQQQFAVELAAALHDSHVLEHAARWALHVQLAESSGRLPQGTAVVPLTLVIRSYVPAAHILEGSPARPLAEALSGPCVRHALLSLGVAVLCAADGGPSYGLPPELLLRLPLLGPNFVPVTRGAPGKQRLTLSVFACMLQVMEGSDIAAAAALPHDGRSLATLLHRIGRFAVTSARAWAQEDAAEAGAVPTQLLLEEAGIMPVALLVLANLRRLSSAAPAAPEAGAATLAEAEAARWRLAVEVATHCMRWAAPDHLEKLAKSLEVVWRPPTPQWLLPPAAPLAVAAALAGGLLPLWERLLRCAGRDPDCAEAALLTRIMASPDVHGVFWALLAYGEPRQGAALVVTLGKLLRTLVVPQVLWSLSQGDGLEPAGSNIRTDLACALVEYAVDLLLATNESLRVAGLADPGGAEASAPQLQLARLASLAACEWLPSLARLPREGMPALKRGVSLTLGPGQTTSYACIPLGMAAVLAWVPGLSRLCWAGREAMAAVTGPPAPEASAAAAAAVAGWRQLLLREVGAVEVLGAIFKGISASMDAAPGRIASSLHPVLKGCCWLAVACPGEARQAVLAAAAEAAPAPGSSGGHGGFGGSGAGGRRRRAGRGGEAGPSRAAAPGPPPAWSPQLFRAMEAELRGCPGGEGEALGAAAGALARQTEQWAAGGGGDCAELARMVGGSLDAKSVARALRASSPAHARALLRTCSNPACDNLAGDSEAGLQLHACGRCGAAWYCRRECLAFHWRSGHKEACVERGGPAAAESGPGRSSA